MNPLIIRIDASSLRYSACARKFYLANIKGYRGKMSSNDIEFGSAVHIFVEQYELTKDLYKSLAAAQDYYKSQTFEINGKKEWMDVNFLTEACVKYDQDSKNPHSQLSELTCITQNDRPLVEQTFSILVYDSPDIKVYLEGTIDKIGLIQNGCYCIDDLKTTSFWNHPAYFRQYHLSAQLMTYKLAVILKARQTPDGLTIFNKILSKGELGCSITAMFLSNKEPKITLERKVFFFRREIMEEYERMFMEFVIQLVQTLRCNGIETLPPRTGIITGACKGTYSETDECPFFSACSAPEQAFQSIMNNSFTQREYNPLSFRKKNT